MLIKVTKNKKTINDSTNTYKLFQTFEEIFTNEKLFSNSGSSKIGRSLKGEEYIKTYNKNKIPGYIKFNSSTIQLEKLIKKYKIKNVIYLAGITKLDECKKIINFQKINIKYPKAIFKTLKKHNIYLIYISSDAVYSGKKGIYKEKDKLNPNCVYGKQKKNVENYIKKNLKYFSIIRISRVIFNEKILKI